MYLEFQIIYNKLIFYLNLSNHEVLENKLFYV